MVTPSERLPSVRYSPRGSSIEGKSRDPNVCFMRELRVPWLEKRRAPLVQERPCKPSRSTLLPQWHVCATQMLAPRRKPIRIRSCWSSRFRPRFLQGTTFSHWDSNLPWWALNFFERLSSILEINSWAVLTKTGCVQFFWVPSRGFSCSFVKLYHFSSVFVNETSSNVSKKIVVRKSLAPKLRPERREGLIMMRMKPQDLPSHRSEAVEYSTYRRISRYTLWKARHVWFCHIFPRELDVQNMYRFSGSTTTLADWSNFSTWKNHTAHLVFHQFHLFFPVQ